MEDRVKRAREILQARREDQYKIYYRYRLEELRADIAKKRAVDAMEDGDEPGSQHATNVARQHLHRSGKAQKQLNAAAAKVKEASLVFDQVASGKGLQGHRYE